MGEWQKEFVRLLRERLKPGTFAGLVLAIAVVSAIVGTAIATWKIADFLNASVERRMVQAETRVGAIEDNIRSAESELRSFTNRIKTGSEALDEIGNDEAKAVRVGELISELNNSPKAEDILGELAILRESIARFPISHISYATGLGPIDEKNTGRIESRKLTFIKLSDNTVIRFGYTDNLRVRGGGDACRWEILINGLSCPSGELVYDYHASGNDDAYRNRHVVGYCNNIPSGEHTVIVEVGPVQEGRQGDCRTGWRNSRWVLEAAELEAEEFSPSRQP